MVGDDAALGSLMRGVAHVYLLNEVWLSWQKVRVTRVAFWQQTEPRAMLRYPMGVLDLSKLLKDHLHVHVT